MLRICLKEILSANSTETNYIQRWKQILQKSMTVILDDCCFREQGGQTDDCQPIFAAKHRLL